MSDLLTLRFATVDDADLLRAIYAPYVESTCISFEYEVPSREEMQRRVGSTIETYPWLVAEYAGAPVGYAYASRHRDRAAYAPSVDLGIYLSARVHRGGVGRRLYGSLFKLLKTQGFHMAFAGISLPNEASVGFHEAMGFTHVGVYRQVGYKFGAWHDTGWWQRALTTSNDAPTLTPITSIDAATRAAALQ